MKLKVVSLAVRDVFGIRQATIEPGRVTVIEGRNGSTKSSLLNALQSALGGGNLAKLARVDPDGAATEPEIVLVLEGSAGETFRVEKDVDGVRVRSRVGQTAAFEDVRKPQQWLTSSFDPLGSNPVSFLTAPDKDRALLLLEALPLKMDRAKLAEILAAVDAGALPVVPEGLHPLEELGLIRDSIFRARTGVNRDQQGKASAAEQTRRNAPATIPVDPQEAIVQGEDATRRLRSELAAEEQKAVATERAQFGDARAAHTLAEEKIKAAHAEEVRGRRAAHEVQAASIRAAAERQIAELQSVLDFEIDAIRKRDEALLSEADLAWETAGAAARTERLAAEQQLASMRGTLSEGEANLAALRAQADESSRARALHEQAQKFDEDAEALKEQSERLTQAINLLDAFRRQLAEKLPVEGLSIEGKEIRVNGVPYEQLNTQAKIDIAVSVACLRSKGRPLPIVFVDGAEALDDEHFEALCARLKAEPIQAVISRVASCDLRVEAIA